MHDLDEVRDRLPHDLETLAQRHGVPGVSVALSVGGEVLEATTGVVSTRSRVPVTSDALFMVQSTTKVLTATLIMQLVDEGLIVLDDPVHAHLPTFRTADAAASAQITIRHLLTHTGGFEGDLWQPTTAGPDALERFVDDLVTRARQVCPPGRRFSYCNAGFGTLGRVVEVLRGMSYEQALRHHLAEPLGIDELAFCADQALAHRTAIGHVGGGDGTPLRPLRHWAVMPPSNPAAGNQLAMSARGLLAIAQMHLDDGLSSNGTPVLSAQSVRAMRMGHVEHPAALGPSSAQGLGWWLKRGGLVEHGGGAAGVASMVRTAPAHRIAAVVLTNGDGGGALIDDLLRPWFEGLDGVEPEPPSPPTPPQHEGTSNPARYVGRFEQRQSCVDITSDGDGRLRYTRTPRADLLVMADRAGTVERVQRGELRPLAGDLFIAVPDDGGGHAVEFFESDERGRATVLFNLDGGRLLSRSDRRPADDGESADLPSS